MPLDFNSDIAPLRSQYFPVGGMRASDHRRMVANYRQNIAPLQDRVMNMESNLLRIQSQDLAFKRSQIAHEQEREKLRLQKQYTDPAAYNRIDEILSQDTDPLQQVEDLHEFARKNPQQLMYNENLAVAHSSALNQLKARQVIKDKQEAPAKNVKRLIMGGLAQEAANYGGDTEVWDMIEGYGADDPNYPQELATSFLEARRASRAQAKIQSARAERREKFKESVHKDTLQGAAYNPKYVDVDLDTRRQSLESDAEEYLKKAGFRYTEDAQAAWVEQQLRKHQTELDPNYRLHVEKLLAKYDDDAASWAKKEGYTGLGNLQVIRMLYKDDAALVDRLQQVAEDYGQELHGDYDHDDDPLTSPDEGNITRGFQRSGQ
tara:strand:- start:3329 stop:4456 length:1128 start_codon:yes stop_codon:yes gene_type:complete